MKVQPVEITAGELARRYSDDGDDGVVGYDEKLNIRPPYQRNFVYDDQQRAAVIETVNKGFRSM